MLIWNVFIDNWNNRSISSYNIFQHASFLDGCKKAAKKHRGDMEAFAEAVRQELMYYFWSKCEWEIVLTSWPTGRSEQKVDVYDQVRMNWDVFISYLWVNKKLLLQKGTKGK